MKNCQNCEDATEILIGDTSPCPQPCTSENECGEETDARCVIYHLDNKSPSELTALNLPNGSSVQTILEAIDTLVENQFKGADGTSGTSGTNGTTGTDGTTGTSGTSGVDGVATSGTYNYTTENPVNIDTFVLYPAQYLQVGDVVTVSGKISITSTTSGQVTLNLSIPVDSVFAFDYQAAGVAASTDSPTISASIIADEVNDEVKIIWTAFTDLEQHEFFFHFTYLRVQAD